MWWLVRFLFLQSSQLGKSDLVGYNSCFCVAVTIMYLVFVVPFQGSASFLDPFCDLCFKFVFVMLSCLFLAAL